MSGESPEEKYEKHIEKLKREITALSLKIDQLRINENRFLAVFNSMEEIYFECDISGNLTYFNPALVRFSGYTKEELKGMNYRHYSSPETSNRMFQAFNEMYRTRKPTAITDYEVFNKNGKTIYFAVSAYPIINDKVMLVGFRGLGRNITQRKKDEDALKKSRLRYRQLYKEAHKSEELYQSLLSSSADAVVLLDTDQRVQFVNPVFTKIFGWTLDELQGKKAVYIPKPMQESVAAEINKVIEEDKSLHGIESQRYTKDGRLLDVSLSASRYLDHAGDPAGVLITLRDISEAKRYFWYMHQAQKMESLGTLASGVAHDFNNLLTGIQGRLSLLMLDMNDSDPGYAHLKDMEDYVVQAADLTHQLLGIARTDKSEVAPTDLNEVIRKHNRMFGRTRKEITIHEELDDALMTVEIDRRQIEQVLLNMYVNASHAMPRGGKLYIRTQNEKLDRKRTQPFELEPGKFIKISITDTGIGMDEATQKRVFEPFFTTRKKGQGTGLGLASAYGIIKNHHGFITLYSEVGRGTTFNIHLPATGKALAEEKASAQEIVAGEGTILLVDDEEMILAVAEEMVKALGYDVIIAGKGADAIEAYRNNKGKITMIVLDMIMPDISGGEVFDQLRKIDPKVKVLLSSGYTINGDASLIMGRGCNGFIQKPFNIQELSKKISEVLAANR